MAPTNVTFPRASGADGRPALTGQPLSIRVSFYREELFRHWRCLEQQREYYSEKTIDDVEAAILKLMRHDDRLCTEDRGEQVVNRLLRTIDGITRLSASTDSAPLH